MSDNERGRAEKFLSEWVGEIKFYVGNEIFFWLKFNPFKLYSLVMKFTSLMFLTFLLRIMISTLKLPVYKHWTFGDDLVSSLLVTFGDEMSFVTNIVQSNIYSNEIFRH